MDRNIVYPGSIPLDTDLLSLNRNAMVALGALAQATLGTTTIVDGLACTPTAPASMQVTVGPGSITALTVVDTLAYGSLAADPTDPLVKMGVNLQSTSFTLTAPIASGQAVNYLIEASFQESDADPVVLPYYNAANPAQPYSGPANDGTAQNTQRIQRVQFQLKPGAAANGGSQTTPAVDQGWVGLYVITLNYGQTAISASSIAALPGAPFLPFKLGQLTPGVSRMAVISTSGPWTVPASVNLIRLRCWGGGGAGGNGGGAGGAGGGGAGGGYSEGYYPVTPGEALYATIGAGGAAGTNGGAGGATGLSALGSATGGGGGGNGAAGASGLGSVAPGAGFGTGALVDGSPGQGGIILGGPMISGTGGTAFGGAGAVAVGGAASANFSGNAGSTPGAGGSGGCGTGNGGNGAPGLMIIEW